MDISCRGMVFLVMFAIRIVVCFVRVDHWRRRHVIVRLRLRSDMRIIIRFIRIRLEMMSFISQGWKTSLMVLIGYGRTNMFRLNGVYSCFIMLYISLWRLFLSRASHDQLLLFQTVQHRILIFSIAKANNGFIGLHFTIEILHYFRT